MSKIVSINAFRRGAGCSNVIANLTALLAVAGKRVGVVDINIQSPSLHLLFKLDEAEITTTLNDYLWNRCNIEQVAHNVTLRSGVGSKGQVFLIPVSPDTEEITHVLRQGYDVELLNTGLQQLVEALQLDVLLIDTQPGLNEETLVAFAISDILVILMRIDRQDYQGTGITVQVAHQLNVPRLMLIVNEVPPHFDPAEVKAEVARTYQCEVVTVLPYTQELAALAGAGIFALHYPQHPLTVTLKHVAASLMV